MKGKPAVLAVAALASSVLLASLHAPSAAAGDPPAMPMALDAPKKLAPFYLGWDGLPDSLALLPPPPEPGSAAMARDEEARRAALRLNGSARYRLATKDAVVGFPELTNDFSCAAGFAIGEQATPALYRLMTRMMPDVAISTVRAKSHYRRIRPFVVHQAPTCQPAKEADMRADGSYPSGHAALGWGYALLLAELVPARTDALLRRGREFGQSRVICDAHWQSDVDSGRMVAAAAIARLHGVAAFRVDLEAARTELARLPQSSTAVAPDCASESEALAGG